MPITSARISQAPVADAPWHPDIRCLHDYWCALRAGRGGLLPARRDLDPTDIPPRIWPHLWLVDWQPEPPRARYRLLGTRIVEFYGQDHRGKWIDEAHADFPGIEAVIERHKRVAASRAPDWRRGRPHLNYDKVRELESIVLPLATDGSTVDSCLMQTRFYGADGREC